MAEDTTTQTEDTAQATQEVAPAAPTTVTEHTAPQDTTPASADTTQEEDPRITKANKEAASYRRQLRDTEKDRDAKAAKLDDLLKRVAALTGQPEEVPLEEQLAAAQARLEEAENANRTMRVESLVTAAARTKGADSNLLLAVLNQQGALAALDPAADDAATQVDALITAAVEQYPQLVAQEAPRRSGNPATPPESHRLLTVEDLETMTPEEIYEAQKAGKFNHLFQR